MKFNISIIVYALALMIACRDKAADAPFTGNDTAAIYDDAHVQDTLDVYSGERFRNVSVKKVGDSTFEVSGQAQVFEAAFSWVIEDGHHEISQGHAMTDAGAPAWGKFSFEVTAAKQEPNSVVQLILFEASPKDGSRQHELPIILYR